MTTKAAIERMKNGKFFSAVFTKKNGEDRTIVGRTGVRKNLTGTGRRYDPKERGYLTVFDVQAKDYRLINLQTLKKVNGQKVG